MPTFLSGGNRGRVHKVSTPSGSFGTIVTGMSMANCLITRVIVSQSTSHQFVHTLGNRIYVYVFGDRMGEIGVAGLAYFDCNGGGNHGIGSVIDMYRSKKVSSSGSKGSITIAQKNCQGYLVGMRMDTARAEENLIEFYLQFALVPEN